MKKISKFFTVGLAAILLLSACGTPKPENAVARVNKDYVTREEFDADFNLYKQYFTQGGEDESMLDEKRPDGTTIREELQKQVVHQLVMSKLIEKDMEDNSITVSDEEVEQKVEESIQQVGGEEEFNTYLTNIGQDLESYKVSLRKGIGFQKHNEWYKENHVPTEEEINSYFEEHKDDVIRYLVSHILVDTEEAAKEIKTELDGGANFETLASEKSIDTGSALQGGSIGMINKSSSIVPEFMEAVIAMNEGEISDPVQTQFGYHIIRMDKVYDDAKELESDIIMMIHQEGYEAYLEDLFNKADVETFEIVPIEKTEDAEQSEEKTEEPKEETTDEKTEEPAEEKPAEDKPAEEKPEENKNN